MAGRYDRAIRRPFTAEEVEWINQLIAEDKVVPLPARRKLKIV